MIDDDEFRDRLGDDDDDEDEEDGQEEEGTCLEISRIGLIAKESESSSARAVHWRRVDERCRERDGCLLLGWRNCGRQQEVAHSPCSLRVHATLEEEEQEEEEEETTM